jgi:predicted DNA-binding ribbon-helix-helix protein
MGAEVRIQLFISGHATVYRITDMFWLIMQYIE